MPNTRSWHSLTEKHFFWSTWLAEALRWKNFWRHCLSQMCELVYFTLGRAFCSYLSESHIWLYFQCVSAELTTIKTARSRFKNLIFCDLLPSRHWHTSKENFLLPAFSPCALQKSFALDRRFLPSENVFFPRQKCVWKTPLEE